MFTACPFSHRHLGDSLEVHGVHDNYVSSLGVLVHNPSAARAHDGPGKVYDGTDVSFIILDLNDSEGAAELDAHQAISKLQDWFPEAAVLPGDQLARSVEHAEAFFAEKALFAGWEDDRAHLRQ